MQHMHDYPVRPRPHQDESIGGFLWRYFGSNGHRIPQLHQDALQLLYREPQAANAAPLQGVCPDSPSLQWLTHHLQLLAEVPKCWGLFLTGRPQVCPLCLKQEGFYRYEWDFPFVTACSSHGAVLQRDCECGRPLRWDGLRPDWCCTCTRSLSDLQVVRASDEQIFLSSLIVRRLKQRAGRLSRLYQNLALLDGLLRQLRIACDSNKKRHVPRCEALLEALVDWPRGLQAMLGRKWLQACSVNDDVTYRYLHASLSTGILQKWLEKQSQAGHRVIKRHVISKLLRTAPIAYRGMITNPSLTIEQYQHRLVTFAAWWWQVTSLAQQQYMQPISTSFNPHSKEHKRFAHRLGLLNNWIHAAGLGVDPHRFISILFGMPGLPAFRNGEPVVIVQQVDQWLAGCTMRELVNLTEATRLLLGQEAGHV